VCEKPVSSAPSRKPSRNAVRRSTIRDTARAGKIFPTKKFVAIDIVNGDATLAETGEMPSDSQFEKDPQAFSI